mmetsp:Transcript_72953/g.235940  ORF Transcript_72953/g.235940 Transcript_72953/m.235940 type:complete len:106 (+) Transcript_72953:107-424(+)
MHCRQFTCVPEGDSGAPGESRCVVSRLLQDHANESVEPKWQLMRTGAAATGCARVRANVADEVRAGEAQLLSWGEHLRDAAWQLDPFICPTIPIDMTMMFSEEAW